MRVELNSQTYVCAEPLDWSYVDQVSDVFRTEGIPLRDDNPVISRVPYSWEKGIGWERQDRKNGSGVGGLRDSTVETRWPIAELALLHETQTHLSASDHPKAYSRGPSGGFYCLFESDYSTGLNVVGVSPWSPDTWTPVDAPLFVGSTQGDTNSASGPLTIEHTVGAAPNRCVVATYAAEHASSGENPTGVTYGGSAMTQGAAATDGNVGSSIWYIINPATGAQDCAATWANAQRRRIGSVADFAYVNQTTPVGATGSDSGTDGTATFDLVTVAGDLAVMGTCVDSTTNHTPGAGQTEWYETALGGGISTGGSGSYERASGTTTTMSTTFTSNSHAAAGIVLHAAGFITASTTAAEGVRGFDLAVHKGNLYALTSKGGGDELDYEIYNSPSGDVWTDAGVTGWPTTDYLTTTITRRNNFDDDEARILDFGNTLMVALHDNQAAGTGQVIRIFYSVNEGADWTAGAVVPSGSGPKAFIRWVDPFSSPAVDSPTLITAEGVWRVDVGGTTFDNIIELDGDSSNGRRAVRGKDGDLYIGLGSGYVRAIHALGGGSWTTRTVGPPGDGLVATRQGHVNFMLAPDWPWLVIAYGGHSGSNTASIFYIEYDQQVDPRSGKVFQAWHHAYMESNANIDITTLGYSAADDATPRLHFALEHASTAEMYHLERPDVSGKGTGVVQKKQTSGIMQFADDPLGDPNTTATFLLALIDADDLSQASTGTSNEFVDYKYGLDGAVWGNVDVGNFYSDDLDLSLGAGSGVSGRRIRNELTLNQNTTANSPGVRDFEVQAFKQQSTLRKIALDIDLEKTRQQAGVAPETQITNLETIFNNGTLVSLSIGQLAAFNVRVRERPRYRLVTENKGDGLGRGSLTGIARVVVEEAL